MANCLAHEDCCNLRDLQQKVGNVPNQSQDSALGIEQIISEVGKRGPGRPRRG